MKKKDKYCRHCGEKMIASVVGAEKAIRWGPFDYYHPYDPYDLETGKRNRVLQYKCPNYGKVWLWKNENHTCIVIDELLTT